MGGTNGSWWSAILEGRWRATRRGQIGERGYLELGRAPEPLSRRQRTIVQRVARGECHGEIAFDLGLRVSTISTHLSAALDKIGLVRTDLPLLAYGAFRPLVSSPTRLLLAAIDHDTLPELTAAELHVARLVVLGLDNGEIACARGSSARTVANQLASIFRCCGICSRLDLATLVAQRLAPCEAREAPSPAHATAR